MSLGNDKQVVHAKTVGRVNGFCGKPSAHFMHVFARLFDDIDPAQRCPTCYEIYGNLGLPKYDNKKTVTIQVYKELLAEVDNYIHACKPGVVTRDEVFNIILRAHFCADGKPRSWGGPPSGRTARNER